MSKIPYRVYLTEEEMPKQWYNLRADMKEQPDPYLHPGTHQPVSYTHLGGDPPHPRKGAV